MRKYSWTKKCYNTLGTTFQTYWISLKAFDLIDADGDGSVTSDELINIIAKVGGSMDPDEARALIRKADMDKNGSIDFTEFSTLWSSLKGEEDVKDKLEIFLQTQDWIKFCRLTSVENFKNMTQIKMDT